VVVLVSASVLGETALTCAQISSTEAHDLGAALNVTKFLIPHLIVLALLTTGFRKLGDVAALVSSAIILLLASLEASIGRSETPSIAANASYLALLQVAILICVLGDLGQSRKLHPRPGSPHHSITGLRFPIVILLLAWGVVALNFRVANRGIETKKAAYKAELDQVFLAWAQRSSLVPLLGIAQCIDGLAPAHGNQTVAARDFTADQRTRWRRRWERTLTTHSTTLLQLGFRASRFWLKGLRSR